MCLLVGPRDQSDLLLVRPFHVPLRLRTAPAVIKWAAQQLRVDISFMTDMYNRHSHHAPIRKTNRSQALAAIQKRRPSSVCVRMWEVSWLFA